MAKAIIHSKKWKVDIFMYASSALRILEVSVVLKSFFQINDVLTLTVSVLSKMSVSLMRLEVKMQPGGLSLKLTGVDEFIQHQTKNPSPSSKHLSVHRSAAHLRDLDIHRFYSNTLLRSNYKHTVIMSSCRIENVHTFASWCLLFLAGMVMQFCLFC